MPGTGKDNMPSKDYYKRGRHWRKNKSKTPTPEQYLEILGKRETQARDFIKRQLINSKGNICALCGQPITDMKDCTIDHIVPVSKGGLTKLENCQLAHRLCNLRKGNQQFDQH